MENRIDQTVVHGPLISQMPPQRFDRSHKRLLSRAVEGSVNAGGVRTGAQAQGQWPGYWTMPRTPWVRRRCIIDLLHDLLQRGGVTLIRCLRLHAQLRVIMANSNRRKQLKSSAAPLPFAECFFRGVLLYRGDYNPGLCASACTRRPICALV